VADEARGATISKTKDWLASLALSLASIVVCLLIIEGALRFMPVSTGLRSEPVDAAHPVLHYAPDRPFVNSLGWDMHNVVHGRVNNAGFVNDQDYVNDGPPLIAVVGDSYIEAQMVAYPQTLQGRLAAALKDDRVYSFAGSGAPLSQYLIWAGHAVKGYGARAVVINVVGNDFDESLAAYRLGPGFWQYAPDSDGVLRLKLNPHHPGTLISLARHSALARYLIINLGIQNSLLFAVRPIGEFFFGTPAKAEPRYAGNTDAAADQKRVTDSLAAIDAFFRDVPERVGLPPDRVAFTLDGFRYADDAQALAGSYFDLMRRAFMQKGAALGYEVIDLDTRFIPRHAKTGERFGFENDNHWNAAGHEVAFEAVMGSKLLARLKQ
jgi:hypothetical protein